MVAKTFCIQLSVVVMVVTEHYYILNSPHLFKSILNNDSSIEFFGRRVRHPWTLPGPSQFHTQTAPLSLASLGGVGCGQPVFTKGNALALASVGGPSCCSLERAVTLSRQTLQLNEV